jgi:diguanylate cyclase (GGDEF)-like protein
MTRSSFRLRVLILVLLAALPALTVIGLAGMNQRDAVLERERTHLAELARAVGLQQQHIVGRADQLLRTLEVLAAQTTSGGPATCMALMADLAKADPGYGSMGITDRHGRVICADAPSLIGRDMAGTRLFRRAVIGDPFVVGDKTGLDALTEELPFARPLRTANGSFTGIAFLGLPIHRLAGAAVDLGLPDDARVDVFDADGHLLMRYPDPEGFQGIRLREEPLAQAARASDGLPSPDDPQDLVDLDGVTRTYAFARLGGSATELMVAVGRPTATAVAEAQRATDVALLGVLALTIATIVLAWTVGAGIIAAPHAATVDVALRDPLTGLHNRRYLDEEIPRLERERALDRRPRDHLAAILFDLDRFGSLNKRHGHAFGDRVLTEFAAVLQERFREGDLVARVGGEEFAVILEVREPADAVRIADQVRERFAASGSALAAGRPLQLGVSGGVAVSDDADASVTTLLAQADVRLRRAKRTGRNRVVGPRIGPRLATRTDPRGVGSTSAA